MSIAVRVASTLTMFIPAGNVMHEKKSDNCYTFKEARLHRMIPGINTGKILATISVCAQTVSK